MTRLFDSRLELIDGRLTVGGTLEGTRCLAATLLVDYGPSWALPSAPHEAWLRGLAACYPGIPTLAEPHQLVEWARHLPYQGYPSCGFARGHSSRDRAVSGALRHGLFTAAPVLGGLALGPDFVMRLGEHGLTPDLLYIDARHRARLHSYYLDGPANLVIEVTHPGRDEVDRVARRRRYVRGGVAEYWEVDPAAQTLACWRLSEAADAPTTVTGGMLSAASVPGLVLDVDALWAARWGRPTSPFRHVSDRAAAAPDRVFPEPDGQHPGWDALPFAPAAGLDTVPIRFEQYLAWCPEAKFERLDGRLSIASDEGTRRVLALLMMTLGLRTIMPYLPALVWILFLHKDHYLGAVETDRIRYLQQATVTDIAWAGGALCWEGSIPSLAVRAIADTREACLQALEERLCDHLLYTLATAWSGEATSDGL